MTPSTAENRYLTNVLGQIKFICLANYTKNFPRKKKERMLIDVIRYPGKTCPTN